MVVFRVGNSDMPAGPKDIAHFSKSLEKALKEGSTLVTHHAVDFFIVDECHFKTHKVIGYEEAPEEKIPPRALIAPIHMMEKLEKKTQAKKKKK